MERGEGVLAHGLDGQLLEACGSAHFWARTLRRLGHDVVLLPPHLVQEAFSLAVGELVHHPDNQARFNRHV